MTFNLSSDLDPLLMPDGRLLLASRQRSSLRRGTAGRVALFGINLDGADYALFADPRGRRVKHMPCVTTGGLLVFVEADQVPWDGAGLLSCVRMRRPLQSYRRITREQDGLFHTPSPLPDGSILVSRRPRDGSRTHGVHRFDLSSGKLETVFDDPDYHDVQAKIVRARPMPDGRSSVVTETDPHGKLYCLNVYTSDFKQRDWMPSAAVKRLRVLEGIPPRAEAIGADLPPVESLPSRRQGSTINGLPPLAQRRVLGEIDVERNGSFNIEVPANTPLELQILDADGMALRSCSWIWAKNHEPRGCVGCHEDGELTPENLFVDAMNRSSTLLCPPPDRRRTVDFRRDGTFADVTEQAGVGDRGYGVGGSAADFDNDGDPDLYVLNYGPNVFYRNNGDGTFTDVSKESGLANPLWSLAAPWFDYDGDGDPDVYVVNYLEYDQGKFRSYYAAQGYPGPLSYHGQPDALYRNNGDGTFTDVTKEAGLHKPNGRGMSATVADLDNDGRLDVYVPNDAMENFFYQAVGRRAFEERALVTGLAFGEGGQGRGLNHACQGRLHEMPQRERLPPGRARGGRAGHRQGVAADRASDARGMQDDGR